MKTYGHMEAITDKRDTATAECFYVLFQKMIGATIMMMKKIINYMEYVKKHFIVYIVLYTLYCILTVWEHYPSMYDCTLNTINIHILHPAQDRLEM